MTTPMEVATTIRDQIGHHALVMWGARDLLGGERSLQFKVGANAARVTAVRIELNERDLYDLGFYTGRGIRCRELETIENVYAEDLRRLIAERTGMYASL